MYLLWIEPHILFQFIFYKVIVILETHIGIEWVFGFFSMYIFYHIIK
jgi:hypothetical protein